MASTKLTRSFSTAGNRKTYTISFWVKLCDTSTNATIINVGPYSGDKEYRFNFRTDRRFDFYDYESGSYTLRYQTNRRFRDVNSWYHFVIAVDTTQSTDSNRVKVYVNGILESNYYVETHPTQNLDTNWNVANNWTIGAAESGNHTNGSISHFYFIDGIAYTPSTFGETDTTTGEWKAKTSPSVTYGTNGFLILKDGNTITDQSSNSNDFTLGGGTLTNLKDNPDNVFATLNPLSTNSAVTLSKGNLEFNYTGGDAATFSTLAASSGKYYWEIKALGADADGVQKWTPGVIGAENHMFYNNRDGGYAPTAYAWYLGNGNIYNNNSSISSAYGTANQNDIIGVALDMDNLKLYFSKNGTFLNSGDPTSGATGTGAISLSANYSPYIPHAGEGSGGAINFVFNFGNGYFGTTAVSSAGTNASDNGIFEYDVPTGYTALSTKGLNL